MNKTQLKNLVRNIVSEVRKLRENNGAHPGASDSYSDYNPNDFDKETDLDVSDLKSQVKAGKRKFSGDDSEDVGPDDLGLTQEVNGAHPGAAPKPDRDIPDLEKDLDKRDYLGLDDPQGGEDEMMLGNRHDTGPGDDQGLDEDSGDEDQSNAIDKQLHMKINNSSLAKLNHFAWVVFVSNLDCKNRDNAKKVILSAFEKKPEQFTTDFGIRDAIQKAAGAGLQRGLADIHRNVQQGKLSENETQLPGNASFPEKTKKPNIFSLAFESVFVSPKGTKTFHHKIEKFPGTSKESIKKEVQDWLDSLIEKSSWKSKAIHWKVGPEHFQIFSQTKNLSGLTTPIVENSKFGTSTMKKAPDKLDNTQMGYEDKTITSTDKPVEKKEGKKLPIIQKKSNTETNHSAKKGPTSVVPSGEKKEGKDLPVSSHKAKSVKNEIMEMIRESIEEMARVKGAISNKDRVPDPNSPTGYKHRVTGAPVPAPKNTGANYKKVGSNPNMGRPSTAPSIDFVTGISATKRTEEAVAEFLQYNPDATLDDVTDAITQSHTDETPLNLSPNAIKKAFDTIKKESGSDDMNEPSPEALNKKHRLDPIDLDTDDSFGSDGDY